MKINQWPLEARPREKLLKHGAAALSDPELLAIFIRTGVKGQTALDISHDLFIRFKNWQNIMLADRKAFCQTQGLGLAKYTELQAVNEVARRCAKESLINSDVLKDTQTTYRYLVAQMKDYRREVFACLFLNSANHLIAFQELFYGTVNITNIHTREVIKAALDCNAVALIAVHNHPSGDITPSEADKRVTYRLKQALELVEIKLLDHVIIGKGGKASSFIEKGLL